MKEAALLFGVFWFGFYGIELLGAAFRVRVHAIGNILFVLSCACIAAYFAY